MTKTKIVRRWTLCLCIITMVFSNGNDMFANGNPQIAASEAVYSDAPNSDSWIIKWKAEADPAFPSRSEILSEDTAFRISVARPLGGSDTQKWIEFWKVSPYVDYIQENHSVAIAAKSNDPLTGEQNYLQQIHAEQAWDEVTDNRDITIALIDTGVDLKHPDLIGNLTKGINLINKLNPPQDDNGHGTNVAGVLAALGNNNKGIAGVVWNAKIMPIKALEANGRGDEDKLGEGIRYAVDHDAKIVVLSVGLYRYSPYMKDVVDYAEQHDVLLISASGNDGKDVKYPAAYPSVLAVGGATPNNTVDPHSNFGPEMDVVAPWSVYTTALGGGYTTNEGTSMAAPQVAGAAALIWAKYANMKPYQIRSLIRQTADDIEAKGWDPYAGYGLLRIDRALKEPYQEDIYENNDSRELAKPLPMDSMVTAEFSSGTDQDWFTLDSPYNGDVSIQLMGNDTSSEEEIQLTHYTDLQTKGQLYSNKLNNTIQFHVAKGKSAVKLNLSDSKSNKPFKYKIVTKFNIYQDAFEDNDSQFKAYEMKARSQSVTGTFHKVNDQDWYKLSVTVRGTVRLKLTSDTERMDLAMMIQKKGEDPQLIDLGGEGDTEYSPLLDLPPGDFYVKVFNAVSDNPYPVTGEYTLNITFTVKYDDPNEPNDKSYQASTMAMDTNYTGVIDKPEDEDWFSFKVDDESLVNFSITNIPVDRIMSLTLNNNSQSKLLMEVNSVGKTEIRMQKVLAKGTYFIRISANQSFQNQMYKLKTTADKLIAGYIDISGHWAQASIVSLTDKKVLSGYNNYLFRPDKKVTRAEAVVMIAKAFNLTPEYVTAFSDVPKEHWAYGYITKAKSAGIVKGYKDGSFAPEQSITRAEMAVMVSNVLGLQGIKSGKSPFTDISQDYWAVNVLRRMKADGRISGYADGSFGPEKLAARAEMAEILNHAIKS